jgi:hypothetical protein
MGRWKPALNAFAITFNGRTTPHRKLTDDEARFTVFIGHPSLTAYR